MSDIMSFIELLNRIKKIFSQDEKKALKNHVQLVLLIN